MPRPETRQAKADPRPIRPVLAGSPQESGAGFPPEGHGEGQRELGDHLNSWGGSHGDRTDAGIDPRWVSGESAVGGSRQSGRGDVLRCDQSPGATYSTSNSPSGRARSSNCPSGRAKSSICLFGRGKALCGAWSKLLSAPQLSAPQRNALSESGKELVAGHERVVSWRTCWPTCRIVVPVPRPRYDRQLCRQSAFCSVS